MVAVAAAAGRIAVLSDHLTTTATEVNTADACMLAPLELTLISDSQSRPSCVHMDHFGLPVSAAMALKKAKH